MGLWGCGILGSLGLSSLLLYIKLLLRNDPVRDENESSEVLADDSSTDEERIEDPEEGTVCDCSNCPSASDNGERITCCMEISHWQRKFVKDGELTPTCC